MKRILVVDDRRVFRSTDDVRYTHAPSSEEGRALLQEDFRRNEAGGGSWGYDEIWLDHDLGPDDDIRSLVVALEERAHQGNSPGYVIRILSSNPVGRQYIAAALSRYYTFEPFAESSV